MQYNNIINILLIEFNELSDEYEKNKDYLDGLPHLVFENIFVPYITELFNKNEMDKMIKTFNFINRMIISQDVKIQEVAVVSILETLLSERELLNLMQPYFNKDLKKSLDDLEKCYGWNE